MAQLVVATLRVVIVLALIGSVIVEAVIVPALWIDLEETPAGARIAAMVIVVAGVVSLQVFAVCVWRLLTLVRRDAVFSPVAFRFVDVIAVAVAVCAAALFALAVLLALGSAAPGVVGLFCGFSLVLAGMALLVVVMRRLLRQAIDSRTEVSRLRSELNEVI